MVNLSPSRIGLYVGIVAGIISISTGAVTLWGKYNQENLIPDFSVALGNGAENRELISFLSSSGKTTREIRFTLSDYPIRIDQDVLKNCLNEGEFDLLSDPLPLDAKGLRNDGVYDCGVKWIQFKITNSVQVTESQLPTFLLQHLAGKFRISPTDQHSPDDDNIRQVYVVAGS